MIDLPGGEVLEGQQPYEALYIHIPFCKSKCAYCDFASEAISADDPRIEAYIDELILSIRAASRADLLGDLKTVYIGGGTPTHIGNKQLSRLLYALSLSMHLTPEVECTLEVNPESLTEAMVKDLFALGVTRLSFGVQSFDDAVLATLGRAHDAEQARKAIERAQLRFENISLDLMCGIPGQSIDSFRSSVEEALSLGVAHVSIYPLTIEEGTRLRDLMDRSAFVESEDALSDAAAEMMVCAEELLVAHGFHRYEVASYARAGFECEHNKMYWTGKPYLGVGHAAVSMKQNDASRVRFSDGCVQEVLTHEQALVEDLMLGMRMSRGVSAEKVRAVEALVPNTRSAFVSLEEKGLVLERAGRFVPSEKGWLYGNEIFATLLDLA